MQPAAQPRADDARFCDEHGAGARAARQDDDRAELFADQLAAGALGHHRGDVGQAQMMASFGVPPDPDRERGGRRRRSAGSASHRSTRTASSTRWPGSRRSTRPGPRGRSRCSSRSASRSAGAACGGAARRSRCWRPRRARATCSRSGWSASRAWSARTAMRWARSRRRSSGWRTSRARGPGAGSSTGRPCCRRAAASSSTWPRSSPPCPAARWCCAAAAPSATRRHVRGGVATGAVAGRERPAAARAGTVGRRALVPGAGPRDRRRRAAGRALRRRPADRSSAPIAPASRSRSGARP